MNAPAITRTTLARCVVGIVFLNILAQHRAEAAPLNLSAVSCATYENEVLQSNGAGHTADPIDTVMWLFGFSVARSGERAMYGESLSAFGFALDAECKNNPAESLLDAVTVVKSKRQNPMDLSALNCSTYETRHVALRKSDPEGATTLTMWLYGYSTGLTDGHVLDADSIAKFDSQLDQRCVSHPDNSLFDAVTAVTALKRPSGTPARPKAAKPDS